MFRKGPGTPRPSGFPLHRTRHASAWASVALAILAGASAVRAQTIDTVAGNGVAAFSGDSGPATSAALNHPRGVAFDASGNLYIADELNHRIRRVTPNGTILTVAGTGTSGFSGDGGLAVNAQLAQPEDVVLDAAGNLYIADSSNQRIRKVTPVGFISTFAGAGSFSGGFNGDNIPAVNAQLNRPSSIAMDSSGSLYIADSSNHRIRKVGTNGVITTVAGNGVAGYSGDGGAGTSASLRFPVGVALDNAGNLFIADAGNHVVRQVTTSGIIFTVAGNGRGAGTDTGSFSGEGGSATSAGLNTPEDIAVDSSGNLYIADTENMRIRKVSGGMINTIAGTGTDGFSGDGGAAIQATMNLPWAISADVAGNLLIADLMNNRIRKITFGSGTAGAPTVAAGGAVNAASFRRASDPNGAIAAGAIVAIFGQDLATGTAGATVTPLPTNLAGTSVSFNGVAAPLFFVSPSQVNVQVPFNMPTGTVTVQVTRNGTVGPPQTVSLAVFSPGLFTSPPGGTGAGAILHADTGAQVSANAPARPNDFLSIYCTGLGPVLPPVASGSVGPTNPLSQTTSMPLVTIAGVQAQVFFSGLAPGSVGLYQVNIQVPAGLPSGTQTLQLTINGVPANAVTLSVQ